MRAKTFFLFVVAGLGCVVGCGVPGSGDDPGDSLGLDYANVKSSLTQTATDGERATLSCTAGYSMSGPQTDHAKAVVANALMVGAMIDVFKTASAEDIRSGVDDEVRNGMEDRAATGSDVTRRLTVHGVSCTAQ